MHKLRETFRIVTDEGSLITVHDYVEVIPAPDFKNPEATVEGLGQLETDDGDAVNDNGDGTFTVVATGAIGRRV